MTVKLYRPFAIISDTREVVNCACGAQYRLRNFSIVNGTKAVICPECGLKPIEVGSKSATDIFGGKFGMEVNTLNGLQRYPEPKDGFCLAILAGRAYPSHLWAGVTENGNFKISTRYQQYNMTPPAGDRRGQVKRYSEDDPRLISNFRSILMHMFGAGIRFSFDRKIDNITNEDVLKKITELTTKGKYVLVSYYERMLAYEYIVEEVLPAVRNGYSIEYQRNPEDMDVDDFFRGGRKFFSAFNFVNSPIANCGALRNDDRWFIRRFEFHEMYVMKRDGRLFMLDENPEQYKHLWKVNRREYFKEKAKCKRFHFVNGNRLHRRDNNDVVCRNVGVLTMQDNVVADITEIYSAWLGAPFKFDTVFCHQPEKLQVVKSLFDFMIEKEANASSAMINTARICGASNYKIIKHGPMDSIYQVIAKRIKRKSFRRTITQKVEELLSGDKSSAMGFMAFVNLTAALSKMSNHGFATNVYTLINDRLGSSSLVGNGLYMSDLSAENFVTAILYLEEFVSQQKILELTKRSLYGRERCNGPSFDLTETDVYLLEDMCMHAFDSARSIEECMDMGLDVDAIRNEIDRAGNSFADLHHHFSAVHRTLSISRNNKDVAEYELNEWQLNLSEEDVCGFDFNVEHPLELTMVGSSMDICVGSYTASAARGQKTIVTMRRSGDDNQYYACLELEGSGPREDRPSLNGDRSNIIQAKMSKNRPISGDAEALKALRKWAGGHNLDIKTMDCRG